jgi:hypothetical protein
VYIITTIAGVTRPDWRISETIAQLPSPHELMLPAVFAPFFPAIFLSMTFVFGLILGPTIFALAFLSTEYGWRGFLLPRLMPLGRVKAHVLTAILWWLSFGPFLMRLWGERPALFGLLLFLLTLVLTVLLGRVSRQSGHIGLTAVVCGAFVCQAVAIWPVLFPRANEALPLGGVFGLVSIALWAAVAAFPEFVFGKMRR